MQAAFSPDGKTLAMWGSERPLTLMDWPDGEPKEIMLPAAVRTALWSSTNVLAVLTAREISDSSDVYVVSRDGAVVRAGGIVGLRWVTRDRLVVSTTSGTDACVQSLGEETRVVFP